MAKYSFPRALFPSTELIQQWSREGSWSPFLQDLRERATEKISFFAAPDKELERFLKPAGRGDISYCSSVASVFVQYDQGAWVADFESMSFIPSEISYLFDRVLSEPFSIAHYAIATFTRFSVVYIPRGVVVQDRIVVHSEHSSFDYAAHVVVVIAEPESEAHIEYTVSSAHSNFTHFMLGLCGTGASVKTVSHERYGSQVIGLSHEVWYADQRSSLQSLSSCIGGAQVWGKKEYSVEEGASVSHLSLSALEGNEQAVLITSQDHKGRESSSSVNVKSVLCGASQSFYRGTITIEESAKKAEAHQQQRALMLSTQARMCAIPSLEVATHDVRCSHGSAAGRFEKEQLQYLYTRGFDREHGYDLLIEGFFNEGLGSSNFGTRSYRQCTTESESGTHEMVRCLKERSRRSLFHNPA
ncbi:SufD family Fe-S cluster assembly protein [Candidatus Dependentiae bacterium]|nr:SufD family Fe-S cluster assembly protein [Candidatus Dependentiae bacterium]